MSFCIPKHIVVKLIAGAKSGDIEIKKLYSMTSTERRQLFQKYVDVATAKEINAGFEQSMSSTQRNAMASWVKDTFVGREEAKRTDIFDKIARLKETGLLDPTTEDNFLMDLVGEKLGITVTAKEAEEISKRSEKLQEEYAKPHDKFGLPQTSYFAEKKKMDDYLKSLNPTHSLKVLTSVAGRGAMLFSVKSPITNIIGNTLQAIEQSFERRIMSKQYRGIVDKELVKEYMKKSAEIYKAGHFDASRADSYSDGSKTLGEMITHSQGKGVARRIGRFYEDVVFNRLMGDPDVIFARHVFVDSANLFATKIAESEGLTGQALKDRANQLFLDASSPSATTPEGLLVREQAKAEALFSTYQNDSSMSELSLGIRNLVNKASGDLMLGDQIMPFVKTPANVISMSLDAGGFGFIKGTVGLLKGAIGEFKAGNPKPLRDVGRNYLRSGMGMLFAMILASLIDPDDFVGLWPTNPSEQELLKAKGGNSNMIRVGGKWISLDYFGFLGSPLVGFMYAKKYGKNLPEAMYNYIAGITAQTLQIPGLEESKNLITAIQSLVPGEYETMGSKMRKNLIGLVDQIRARIVPGFVSDLAKAFDDSEREADPDSVIEKLMASIPGLRNQLPRRTDVFGEVIKGEPWYSVILFGARVKTGRETEVVKEMSRLEDAGQLPALTRPEKTSPRVKALKEQLGDEEFAKAMMYFRGNYYEDVSKKINSGSYKRLSDEDKKKELNKIKDDNLEQMLKKYKYKKPKSEVETKPTTASFSLVKAAYAADGLEIKSQKLTDEQNALKRKSKLVKFINGVRNILKLNPDVTDSIAAKLTGTKKQRYETMLKLRDQDFDWYKSNISQADEKVLLGGFDLNTHNLSQDSTGKLVLTKDLKSGDVKGVAVVKQPTPTVAETKVTATEKPTEAKEKLLPTITKNWPDKVPYLEEAKKIWKGVDPHKVVNVLFGESSLRNSINANVSNGKGKIVPLPLPMPKSREEWKALRAKYPSIDVGISKINTNEAMTNYLESKGLTYYDLIVDPELNLQIGYDLYSGKIPRTAPGWGNWYAARNLGYDKNPD